MEKNIESLTIFFPAYNEEKNIASTILNADAVARKIASDYEILVVNDGSQDNTQKIVSQFQSQLLNLKLFNHPKNLGYGAALTTGFSQASKKWVIFTDSDGQFDLSEIVKLLPLTDSHKVVVGYRLNRKDSFIRCLNAKGWNLLNRLLFGLKVKDIDCAFKLIENSVAKEVLPEILSKGAMFSAELLIRLQSKGYCIAEVGIQHFPRQGGSATGAKPEVIIRAFKEMATVYRGDLGTGWIKQVIKFMLVGVANTFLDISLYFLLSRYVPFLAERKVWAKGLSYGLGVINSFIWNRAWTFKSQKNFGALIPFALISFASLAINTSVMYLFLAILNFEESFALIVTTLITFIWNFLASKKLVFRS
jgi:glycosyltransferase involved in cell wall biosynthesis